MNNHPLHHLLFLSICLPISMPPSSSITAVLTWSCLFFWLPPCSSSSFFSTLVSFTFPLRLCQCKVLCLSTSALPSHPLLACKERGIYRRALTDEIIWRLMLSIRYAELPFISITLAWLVHAYQVCHRFGRWSDFGLSHKALWHEKLQIITTAKCVCSSG